MMLPLIKNTPEDKAAIAWIMLMAVFLFGGSLAWVIGRAIAILLGF
jgi:hypothetical protein